MTQRFVLKSWTRGPQEFSAPANGGYIWWTDEYGNRRQICERGHTIGYAIEIKAVKDQAGDGDTLADVARKWWKQRYNRNLDSINY